MKSSPVFHKFVAQFNGNDYWYDDIFDGKPAEHIVLDLETWSLRPSAAIASIGAVALDEDLNPTDYFYASINLASCLERGFHVDASTLRWWGQPSNSIAYSYITSQMCTASPIDVVLPYFFNWVNTRSENARIWGNGAEFDNAIIRNAAEVLNISNDDQWAYYANQSIRTLSYLNDRLRLNILHPTPIIPHVAIYDAWAEAEYVQKVLRAIMRK